MSRPKRHVLDAIDQHALAVKRIAIAAGWTVKSDYRAGTGSAYLRLTHPDRRRCRVRVSNHVPAQPTKKTMHVITSSRGSLAILRRWLAGHPATT